MRLWLGLVVGLGVLAKPAEAAEGWWSTAARLPGVGNTAGNALGTLDEMKGLVGATWPGATDQGKPCPVPSRVSENVLPRGERKYWFNCWFRSRIKNKMVLNLWHSESGHPGSDFSGVAGQQAVAYLCDDGTVTGTAWELWIFGTPEGNHRSNRQRWSYHRRVPPLSGLTVYEPALQIGTQLANRLLDQGWAARDNERLSFLREPQTRGWNGARGFRFRVVVDFFKDQAHRRLIVRCIDSTSCNVSLVQGGSCGY